MQTDITRQVSASVYTNSSIRNKIFEFAEDPYHAVVESYGINTTEVLKHVFNARKKSRNFYQILFIPSIIFWYVILLAILTEGQILDGIAFLIGYVCFFIIYGIVLVRDLNHRAFLKENLYKDSYNPNFTYNTSNSHLIPRFQKKTSRNIIVYSGYSPFVGSGIDIGGWSFVVDIDKGKRILNQRIAPMNFELSDLYSIIEDEIVNLNIPNITINDKVFINGKKIRRNPDLLPDKLGYPVNTVSEDFLTEVMNRNNTDARFYKVIQVTDWEGDLVLSAFLRFQKSEKSLFVECNYFLLPPIREEYKNVDTIKEESGIKYFIKWVLRLVGEALLHSLLSIFNVYGYISEVVSGIFGGKEATMRKIVKKSPDFDYGAKTSIRETLIQHSYSQHFQKLDKERYFKTVEKRIFNTLEEFLDMKNIDTSEFKERETSILNNGVLVTGGNLKADNIAIGEKSKITTLFKGNANGNK